MRTRKQIQTDITAAEKTAQGATTALEKMADTLSALKAKVGLGGSDNELQTTMSKKAAEEFKRGAAQETLEALQLELARLEAHEERQDRLKDYAKNIEEAKAKIDEWNELEPKLADALEVLNKASVPLSIEWLPPAWTTETHSPQGIPYCQNGARRLDELKSAIATYLAPYRRTVAMTPEQLEESRNAA